MTVAGIGCRKGASTAAVLAAVHAAVTKSGIGISALDGLATVRIKAAEQGIVQAAKALALELIVVGDDDATRTAGRGETVSDASIAASGLNSVAEAAALAAAGPSSRLLQPRIAVGPVTCAIAQSGGAA